MQRSSSELNLNSSCIWDLVLTNWHMLALNIRQKFCPGDLRRLISLLSVMGLRVRQGSLLNLNGQVGAVYWQWQFKHGMFIFTHPSFFPHRWWYRVSSESICSHIHVGQGTLSFIIPYIYVQTYRSWVQPVKRVFPVLKWPLPVLVLKNQRFKGKGGGVLSVNSQEPSHRCEPFLILRLSTNSWD